MNAHVIEYTYHLLCEAVRNKQDVTEVKENWRQESYRHGK